MGQLCGRRSLCSLGGSDGGGDDCSAVAPKQAVAIYQIASRQQGKTTLGLLAQHGEVKAMARWRDQSDLALGKLSLGFGLLGRGARLLFIDLFTTRRKGET